MNLTGNYLLALSLSKADVAALVRAAFGDDEFLDALAAIAKESSER